MPRAEAIMEQVKQAVCARGEEGLHYVDLAREMGVKPITAYRYLSIVCEEVGRYWRGRCYPDPSKCRRDEGDYIEIVYPSGERHRHYAGDCSWAVDRTAGLVLVKCGSETILYMGHIAVEEHRRAGGQ